MLGVGLSYLWSAAILAAATQLPHHIDNGRLLLQSTDGLWYWQDILIVDGDPVFNEPELTVEVPGSSPYVLLDSDDGFAYRIALYTDENGVVALRTNESPSSGTSEASITLKDDLAADHVVTLQTIDGIPYLHIA